MRSATLPGGAEKALTLPPRGKREGGSLSRTVFDLDTLGSVTKNFARGPKCQLRVPFPGRYATFMAGNRLDSVKGRVSYVETNQQIHRGRARRSRGGRGVGADEQTQAGKREAGKHCAPAARLSTVIPSGEKARKTAKGSATPPAIMKRSSARKSPEGVEENTPTS